MTDNTHTHTPGPWKVEPFVQSINSYPNWHSFTVRHDRTNVHIATVGDVDRYYEKNNEANARLIASAPDLLAALESLVEMDDDPIRYMACCSYRIDAARAAIEKAKGS